MGVITKMSSRFSCSLSVLQIQLKKMDQKMIGVKIRKICDSFVISSFPTRANLKCVALIFCWDTFSDMDAEI